MEIILIPIIVFIIFLTVVGLVLKQVKSSASRDEIIIGAIYVFSLALFAIGMVLHDNPYYRAIDPINMECYSPFSNKHIPTGLFYFFAFNFSMLLVWTSNKMLPPLTLTLCLIFITIGVILNIATLIHVSAHNTETLDTHNSAEEQLLFLLTPIMSILLGARFLFQSITRHSLEAINKTYSNKYLNRLNIFLTMRNKNPFWIVILIFPVFLFVTLILILFGQDFNSIVKIFTDTATWRLSQQVHPPIIDNHGHYLCTVAAKGDPRIVKPLRMGRRHGMPIIVNRQLLIANAFEEMVQDLSPKLHYIIRTNYDRYGYNISKKINTTNLSNLTYISMKPLEWLFLVCLYLFSQNPEQKINKQYAV